jgi:hypothetical protein
MKLDLSAFRQAVEKTPRITVLVGEFGSGKTELAVNLASYMQKAGVKTAIVDMDLVKPYFRTREHRDRLEAEGVTVVMPEGALAHADLPIMPEGLTRVLFSHEYRVVIDVGGSKSAIVLGQVRDRIRENGSEVLLVVNVCRPFSANATEVISAMRNIEAASGLAVTGLVSNTNMGAETTPDQVNAGLKIVREVSELTGLPLRWLVVPDWMFEEFQTETPLLPLQLMTTYPWQA